ncbi:MAG: AI-2E family transporter [Clostridia bacterium]|nr:AI-2E family transporter [Clostridia bacterium]
MKRKKTVLYGAGIAVLGFSLYAGRAVFAQVLTVFALAAAFTLILAPLCRKLEQKGLSPSLASALCVSLFVLVAALIVSAFVPYLIAHSIELIRRTTPTLTNLLRRSSEMLGEMGVHLKQQNGVTDMIARVMSSVTAWLAKSGVAFATQTGQIAFSLVLTYYLLKERGLIVSHLILLLPLSWRMPFLSAMLGCKNAVLGYLSGVLKTSVFVALATFAGLAMLGVRDAWLLSLFMGVFEILPYIGPVLASVPILLSTLPQGLYPAMLALLLVIAVQQVEGNFISPYFTASSTSIHPLAALVSVFVLGSLFGLWGILLAVPLVVTARSVMWSVKQTQNMMNP